MSIGNKETNTLNGVATRGTQIILRRHLNRNLNGLYIQETRFARP